ncbi:2-keto-4-pentenoate hydratase/2-oxohepta-3-ene-1,7-dioic acid hydratase in catechol pathway [Caldalkalibacillus uzonensis]|uniref:2-keto-4-pentenoate hydratase/2-oxohepta-3-ene-1,7-dioic acid hydratase in catechol pathway n=1 Tax=Caldalkalibacillus uzonensis TaxID=353224 RepID=A0ABU0CR20_9BACI|nr:fumarylacetoacetate hydrolase family protein [Caldalkalibacillus uzonensis]MDQ0338871.1 2-keto-4-pentenoate hydratase/2-oxohepta-3-ene-1,7-dioic acid hydratase in catechol pathway [Caldalkalibacillus uzonensis]
MKFITFLTTDNEQKWGIVHNSDTVVDGTGSGYARLLDVIRGGDPALAEVKEWFKQGDAKTYAWDEVKILPPIKPPKNVICVGKNYAEHALEMSNQDPGAIPKYPVFFTKPHTSLIGQGSSIDSHPHITEQLDYEGELAVVIGKWGKNIPASEALEYVFGYSILNDITARDLQSRHKQFFKGKSLDTFAPFGPVIVHKSLIEDPQQLNITTIVNGEVRQNSSTQDMIFPVAELIESISAGMTLEPGDVIATGTPSGVGKGFNPPKLLKAGDEVSITIEPIGTLTNRVE